MDQMRMASMSIMSSIAEGFDRGMDLSNGDYLRFLAIAKAACAELQSQPCASADIVCRAPVIIGQKPEQAREVSRLLVGVMGAIRRHSAAKKPAKS
jgi:four helix bundle protein